MTTNNSKIKYFKDNYLDQNGCSEPIERYGLGPELAYTSGDSPVFRSDSPVGKEYKFMRFSPTLDFKKRSNSWKKLTEEDKEMLTQIHSKLIFPKKGDDNYHGSGTVVYYLQFFGKGDKIIDQGIKPEIRKEICKLLCSNCKTNIDIQCDHKNDLKNDPRVLSYDTQTMDDFQPLCRHCNDVKRGVKCEMMKLGKRIGAKKLDYNVDFTQGDETLDMDDPDWYKGTYWGDCKAFKQSLNMKN
tara:strand:+ start:106 stop:831 length:726 start_codon:yes stop_codon:yes gene_type:complete